MRSGTGEDLGTVTGVELDGAGRPARLAFVEGPGEPPRFVPLRFVREVAEGVVHLAGPRDGYHITRVGIRTMPDLAGEEEA